VSDFTSGTVTSASTAQQAGTAVYAVNSGTAVYATTSGTAVYSANSGTAVTISGTITKSQVSDFTSGTVAQADNATTSGTAVYATNSGTAVYADTSGTATYATTSGTAVTISGDITKSQVSDFTSGTVTSASTAQQSGTAVYAQTSGTATFATTSGTATYANNSGTAVFATNASTAVSVSGSAITQSQVVNLVSDLAGKASLGANTFTGAQTVNAVINTNQYLNMTTAGNAGIAVGGFYRIRMTAGITEVLSGGATNPVMTVQGATSQSANLLEWRESNGGSPSQVNNVGQFRIRSFAQSFGFTALGVAAGAASELGIVVRGAASQTANLQEWQNSAGVVQARIDSAGMGTFGALGVAGSPSGISYAYFTTPSAGAIPIVVRGAASQTADLLSAQNSAGGTLFSIASSGGVFTNSTLFTSAQAFIFGAGDYGAALNVQTRATGSQGLVIRGRGSQSANLQEWQNSAGSVLASVSSSGTINGNLGVFNTVYTSNYRAGIRDEANGGHVFLTKSTSAPSNPGAGNGNLYFRDGTNAGTLKLVVRAGAAGAETTILDNIPQ
jgi:hypothetical protein